MLLIGNEEATFKNPSMSLREWGKLMIIFNREAMWSCQGHGNTCARKFQLNHLSCSFQSYVLSCEPEVWIARPPWPSRHWPPTYLSQEQKGSTAIWRGQRAGSEDSCNPAHVKQVVWGISLHFFIRNMTPGHPRPKARWEIREKYVKVANNIQNLYRTQVLPKGRQTEEQSVTQLIRP